MVTGHSDALGRSGLQSGRVNVGGLFNAATLGLVLAAMTGTPLLFAIGVLVLQRTRFGHATFAIGGSREAATLMGLPVARNTMLLYLGSGLCAGLAGALAAAYSASGVTIVGEGLELDAIAAVVIGGTLLTGGAGTVAGTVAGVLLLRVIQNGRWSGWAGC